jgi:DNA polymerase
MTIQVVRLASETDFPGWRAAARTLRARRVAPEEALWTVDAGGDLFDDAAVEPVAAPEGFTVPRAFLDLAGAVIRHRSDERFALLYQLLWRLGREANLLSQFADPDVRKAQAFAQAVAQAEQQMRAFAQFRGFPDAEGRPVQVAWFEPAHRVTEGAAEFFTHRYARRSFALLTPDVCAHWDGRVLGFTPGADPADAPREADLEAFWRNLAAAAPIPQPIRRPQTACLQTAYPEPVRPEPERPPMARQSHKTSSERLLRAVQRTQRDAAYDGLAPTTLEEVHVSLQMCRRCDLYRDATQGVSGEGPARARLMLVGEQPGDQEDLAGRPFVGPAGQMLDKALAQAGVPRDQAFVTNAVKHFKHELRGKKRIHKTPAAGEVAACRWWLDSERRLVRPRVIVALGATAALSVFGKPTPIGPSRQKAHPLADQAQGVVTYHPAYLLRMPDYDAREKAYGLFVDDLKFAWGLAG